MTWDGTGVDPFLPARIASEITLTRAERRMYQEWWGSFSSWLVGVHRSVLGSNVRPDASAIWQHAPAWAEQMKTLVQGPVRDTMGLAYEALFGPGYDFDARPFVASYLGAVHNRMVRTPNEVFDQVAAAVARGAGRGDSIPDIAASIDEILTATGTERWAGRAQTIARTETLASLNAGRHDAAVAMQEELGEPLDQVWLATLDQRTRSSHAEADGARVPVGEPFTVGGASLEYPGDPFGPPSETISCRCTTLVVGADEEVDMTGRQFTDDWDTWEDELDDGTPVLPEHRTPPPPSATTSKEEQARARQVRIDTARTGGKTAAELDEMVANLEGDITGSAAVDARIAAGVARGAIPEDVATELRAALKAGDSEAFTATAWRYAESLGAVPVERAGQVVAFDPKLHKAIEGRVSGQVMVVRPGLRWVDEDLLLEKAVVEQAADADVLEARFAQAATGQKALDASPLALDLVDWAGDRQLTALVAYRNNDYEAINRQLRSGTTGPAHGHLIEQMDAALEGSRLTDDVVVFRGIGDGRVAFGDRIDGDLTGVSWTERAFVSTSVDEEIAREFAFDANPGAGHVLLRLVVPEGTGAVRLSGIRLSAITEDVAEGELLLQRGLRMRVVKDYGVVDGVRRLDVEVLPATKASRKIREATEAEAVEARFGAAASGQDALDAAPIAQTNKEMTGGPLGVLRVRSGEDVWDAASLQARVEALDHYGLAGFHSINELLRTGKGGSSKWVKLLDDVMAHSRLTHDTVTWRGMRTATMFGARLSGSGSLVGFEWRELAYVSTGKGRQTAERFAMPVFGSKEMGVVMRVRSPAGTGAVELSMESELLLQRGLRMRVVADHGVHTRPGPDKIQYRLLDVEVIP